MHVDPQILLNESRCYSCLGVSISQSLRLALIARTVQVFDAQANVTPAYLVDYGKCYECYGASIGDLLELALLDQLSQVANTVPPPDAPEGLLIDDDSTNGDTQLSWTNGSSEGETSQIWVSPDGVTYSLLDTVDGALESYSDATVIGAGVFAYYKVRSCNGGSCSDFTNVLSVCNGISKAGASDTELEYPTLVLSYGNITFTTAASLTIFSTPILRRVDGDFFHSGTSSLETLSCPALTEIGGFYRAIATFMPALTVVDFSALVTVGGAGFRLTGITALASMDLSALVTIVGSNLGISLQVAGGNVLQGVSLSTWPCPDGTQSNFASNNFNAASVDAVLALAIAEAPALTTSTIALNGAGMAAPGVQGALDKADLISAGNTVTTN